MQTNHSIVMYTFLIVDADTVARKQLREQLLGILKHCHISEARSIDEALGLYIARKPNLIFLDVDLPDRNGFEFIHELLEAGESPRVALVTQQEQYAIQAIRASVIDYLLKPVAETELRICLKRLQRMEEEEQEYQNMHEFMASLKMKRFLRVNTRTGFEVIKPEEILCCEADGNYTRICLTNGFVRTTSTTLGAIEQQLPSDMFFRVGRSVLVNLNYLRSVDRKERICVLQCGEIRREVPLSLNRVQELSMIF